MIYSGKGGIGKLANIYLKQNPIYLQYTKKLPPFTGYYLRQGSLDALDEVAGSQLHLFKSMTVATGGKVVGWKLRANTGVLFLSMWRENGTDQFELIGKSEVHVATDQYVMVGMFL